MTQHSDIVIVGGGVISLLSAYYLQKMGAKISIIDKGEIGKESSWAGGGIISPLYPWRYADEINLLSAFGQQHYAQVTQKLRDVSSIDPQYVESGLLMLDVNDDPGTIKAWQKRFNKRLEWLAQSEIQRYEPKCDIRFTRGVKQDDVGQVRNPWLMRSLRVYLENLGIEFLQNKKVEAIRHANNRAQGVRVGNINIAADKVIVACGAWSSLFPEFSVIDVRPVMGQMVLYKTRPGFLQRIVMAEGRYVIPRNDGHILCGSTLEWNGYDKVTTPEVREELKQAAQALIPELANIPIIKQWSGLRPGSPNGVPYISEHPEIKGLFVNTGHYRYGVVMGLGSARLLADIIGKQQSFVDPADFALDVYREPSKEFRQNS